MRIVETRPVTPGMLVSSTVPETDYPAWSSAVTYGLGDRVILNHRIWESVQSGNNNHNPSTDTLSEWWVDIGATNRWRAFDGQLSPPTSQAANIKYVITLNTTIDTISMFGLIGSEVRIIVRNGGGGIEYNKTIPLASARVVTNWWDWFFAPFVAVPSLIEKDIPGILGFQVEIEIFGSGVSTRAVGEIMLGVNIHLGDTLVDTAPSFRDFSIKERDPYGGFQIVERGWSRTVDYRFAVPQNDVGRVIETIARNRARMCVFMADDGPDVTGTTVLGFVNEDGLSIPITTNICFATLSVEGLTED